MPYILNLLYLALVVVASPWLVYQAIRNGKYREGYAEKLLGRVPVRGGNRPCIWLHAVSVGEVNLLHVLIKELRKRRPEAEIVVSSTTRTGLELARKKYADLTTFYCPLDFSWACRTAMKRLRPSLLVLAELELWPNLIRAADESGVPVAVVNGRLSEKSFRGYRRIRFFVERVLAKVSLVAAQNDEYAARFRALGCEEKKLVATGSLKFDGASTDRANLATQRLARLAGFQLHDVVFLAGSTQVEEEEAAVAAYRALAEQFPHLRLVIVPRHAERFEEVAKFLERSGLPFGRRSQLEPNRAVPRVLLVDGHRRTRSVVGHESHRARRRQSRFARRTEHDRARRLRRRRLVRPEHLELPRHRRCAVRGRSSRRHSQFRPTHRLRSPLPDGKKLRRRSWRKSSTPRPRQPRRDGADRRAIAAAVAEFHSTHGRRAPRRLTLHIRPVVRFARADECVECSGQDGVEFVRFGIDATEAVALRNRAQQFAVGEVANLVAGRVVEKILARRRAAGAGAVDVFRQVDSQRNLLQVSRQ